MINVRLVVPPRLTRALTGHLAGLDTVTHVVVLALSSVGGLPLPTIVDVTGASFRVMSRSTTGARPVTPG